MNARYSEYTVEILISSFTLQNVAVYYTKPHHSLQLCKHDYYEYAQTISLIVGIRVVFVVIDVNFKPKPPTYSVPPIGT